MREEPFDTPRSPVKELKESNLKTAQISVNLHDMPNDCHGEAGKRQIQALDTSGSHSRHTSHELTSHESGIVAAHQPEKPIAGQHSSVTLNVEAGSLEPMEIDEDPGEIFAFVYDDVASHNVQNAQPMEDGEIDESAEDFIKNNIRRNRMHGMPGYEEEKVQISTKQDIEEEHGEVLEAHSVQPDIIRETARVQHPAVKEVQVMTVAPVEPLTVAEEP